MEEKIYINVDLDNIVNNFKKIRKKYNNYKYYMADVSSNAYGHGILQISRQLIKEKIDYLIVDNLKEALIIRKKHKYIPILCKKEIPIKDIYKAIKKNISLTISTEKFYIEMMKLKLNKMVKVHLNLNLDDINKGISKNLSKRIDILFDHPKIYIEGLSAVLYNSCDIIQMDFDNQINNLVTLFQDLDLNEFDIINIYNSKDLFCHKKLVMANTVRIEDELYGYCELEKEIPIKLMPAFELIAKVEKIITLDKNEKLDDLYKAKLKTRVAEIPIGLKTGLTKDNEKRNVSVSGRRFKLIGEIKDEKSYVYVDDTVKKDSKVNIIGGIVSLKEVCNYLQCSFFELLSNFPKQIKRNYQKTRKFNLLK